LWGANHLLFVDDPAKIVIIAIYLILLILPFSRKTVSMANNISGWYNNTFHLGDKKYIYRIVFVLICVCLFIIFTAPTHFLGDGYAALDYLSSEGSTIYKWSESGTTTILSLIQMIIGGKSEQTSLLAFQIVSVISGLITIWFYFLLAEILNEDKSIRFIIFIILLFSGNLLLFFGYVENYPLLWVAITGYIYFSIRYQRNKTYWFLPLIFLTLGIFLHMQITIFVPSIAFLYLAIGSNGAFYRRYKKSIWSVITFMFIICLAVFIYKLKTDLYFEVIFLPLLAGRLYRPDYTIFSFKHFLDMFNLLLLLSPVLPLLICYAGKIKDAISYNTGRFLLITAICSLLFLLVIDPKLGMARDWDLFSLSAISLTLLMILAVSYSSFQVLLKFIPSILLFLIVSTVPYLQTHLNENNSLDYFRYTLKMDDYSSLSGIIVLRDYFKKNNDFKKSDSLNALIYELYPDLAKTRQALKAVNSGDFNKALEIFQTITPDEFSADYHSLRGSIYLRQNKLDSALIEIKKAIQLRKYKPSLQNNLALVYARMGNYEKSLDVFREVHKRYNERCSIIYGIANVFIMSGNFDSALHYSEKLVSIDSGKATGYYMLSKIYIKKGDAVKARENLNQYFKYSKTDPLFMRRSSELLELLNKIETNSSTP
jgi:tetratricopeptide (TPR) repeat protein